MSRRKQGMEKGDGEERRAKRGSNGGGGTGERFAEWLLYIIFSLDISKAGLVCPNE